MFILIDTLFTHCVFRHGYLLDYFSIRFINTGSWHSDEISTSNKGAFRMSGLHNIQCNSCGSHRSLSYVTASRVTMVSLSTKLWVSVTHDFFGICIRSDFNLWQEFRIFFLPYSGLCKAINYRKKGHNPEKTVLRSSPVKMVSVARKISTTEKLCQDQSCSSWWRDYRNQR
jgi:hypothetical protein